MQLLIARLSVSPLKQLNFARERTLGQIARGDEKNISYRTGHNIIRYSNFGDSSFKSFLAIELIDVSEIKPVP